MYDRLPKDQIAAAIADAELARIPAADLPATLDRHRAGDDDAARRLVAGFNYLIWRQYRRHRPSQRISGDDLLGLLLVDLATAVDRLRRNDAEPEDYIEAHLRRTVHRFAAEEADDIAPRRKDGKGAAVTRTHGHPEPPRWEPDGSRPIDVLSDPLAPLPLVTPAGDEYRVPSRFQQDSPAAEIEAEEFFARLIPYCQTKLESRIVRLALAGNTTEDIADLRGVSIKQIENIIARLERRAA